MGNKSQFSLINTGNLNPAIGVERGDLPEAVWDNGACQWKGVGHTEVCPVWCTTTTKKVAVFPSLDVQIGHGQGVRRL